MLLCLVTLIVAVSIETAVTEHPGSRVPPTKGEIWPEPINETKEQNYYVFQPSQFKFLVTDKKCDILTRALERYVYAMKAHYKIARRNRLSSHRHQRARHLAATGETPKWLDHSYRGLLRQLNVTLTVPCEEYPQFGMDEAYTLKVAANSTLQSHSIWGILRGLESFSQLIYLTDDYSEVRLNGTTISDAPLYPHRGLLLDTSRHFIQLDNILTTLDAMAMNKMNVFHWHIVDDQSFPYQSERFPNLSKKGAFHHSMVYSKKDIQEVVNYARDRGIRVLPEFDVPGHTRSWGEAYPDILTQCWHGNEPSGLGPMNPLHNVTYSLLKDLFKEVNQWFPETYIHVGGDEVDLTCWASNPEILSYMAQHGIDSVKKMHALFMERAIPLLPKESTPIVWQEVFDNGVPLSNDTIVHVWKSDNMDSYLSAGHRVVYSSGWYLDHLRSGGDWTGYYAVDPRELVQPDLVDLVLGGEACMWGEVVDDTNVISRVWPRGSAAAERLWSGEGSRPQNRLEEHTCRMWRRGVRAQPPNGPGFCVL